MGATLQNNSNNGNRRNIRRRNHIMSEINVTPMVDVMLVLLVVFMITAPLLTVGVPVDLPKSNANSLGGNDEPLVITMKADGQIYIQETPTPADKLISRLIAITNAKSDQRIFIRADQALSYGDVMIMMGKIAAAGFKKVSLLTKQPHS